MSTVDLGLAAPGCHVLLIGSGLSAAPDVLPPVPAVHRTLTDLAAALREHCGVTPERLTVLEDPPDTETFARAVSEAARAAHDTLLLYYVGHGLVGARNELRLCTRATTGHPDTLPYNTLAFGQVLDLVRRYKPERLITVLDCCHGARAADDPFTGLRRHYLLPAAARDEVALAPPDAAHTVFSGELLALLDEGDPGASAQLTLEDVRRRLAGRGLEPRVHQDSTTGWFALARNKAFVPGSRSVPGPPDTGICPYPGLAPFEESNQRWFHGREQLSADLAAALTSPGRPGLPLILLGVSGVGKSSLLRAGLLPALRRGAPSAGTPLGWEPVLLAPTEHPLDALAQALSEPADMSAGPLRRLLADEPRAVADRLRRPGLGRALLVDQFEETFNLCEDARERTAFIRAVTELAAVGGDPRNPLAVLLSLTAHSFAACAERPELVRAVTEHQFVVPPLSPREIRAAVTEPARQENLRIEAGLLDLILTDLGHGLDPAPPPAPGGPERATAVGTSLVHLAQALTATWERRVDGVLTVRGYHDSGGIAGAITQSADEVLRGLDPDQRLVAQQLLLRTVRPGRPLEGVPPVRTAVDRDTLVRELGSRHTLPLLDRLLRAGLLTQTGRAVQPAHEALLQSWPLMRRWLAADPEWRVRHAQLTDAAASWRDAGENEADLYRGHTLSRALELTADRTQLEVGAEVLRFLGASVRSQRSATRRARSGRRLLLLGATTSTVVLTAASVLGWVAYRAQERATAEAGTLRSRQLAASALALRHVEPVLAGRLAVAAEGSARTDEAWAALIANSGLRPADSGGRSTDLPAAVSFAVAPDRRVMALAGGDQVQLFTVDTRTPVASLRLRAPAVGLAFSPDGRWIVVASYGFLLFWDASAPGPEPVRRVEVPDGTGFVDEMTFSHDSTTVALTAKDSTRLVTLGAGPTPRVRTLAGEALRYDAGGRLLTGLDGQGRLLVRRVAQDGTEGAPQALPGSSGPYVGATSVTADAGALAALRQDGTAELWSLSGEPRRTGTVASAQSTEASPALSPDGRLLALAGIGGVQVWDVHGPVPALLGETSGHGPAQVVAFLPDGERLLVADASSTRMWDTRALLQPGAVAAAPVSSAAAVAYRPDGQALAVGGADGAVSVRAVTGEVLPVPAGLAAAGGRRVQDLAFAPDGHTLMVVRGRGVELWNTADTGAAGPVALVPGVRAAVASGAARLSVRTAHGAVEWWGLDSPARPRLLSSKPGTGAAGAPVALVPDGSAGFTGSWWDLTDPASPRAVGTAGSGAPADTLLVPGADGALAVGAGLTEVEAFARPGKGAWTAPEMRGLTPTALALAPDGSLAATGDDRGTVRLWRRTGAGPWRALAELPRRAGRVTALALSASGGLAVAVADGPVMVSDLSRRALVSGLCAVPAPSGAEVEARWLAYGGRGPLDSACDTAP
ncbi:caspase family protein [Streptomyces sp. NBC_00249]|uniref:AAA family ATPase n=1 Tax=Streptomyces sp. NBC_00249 TaxID=2975690 RepID=UPI0022545299|nr:AAA family ATPase [Streptomyces sp. NBC_00249]MCX5192403.1 caspase family protein [Streptomyces sp. NBC_00249]